MKQKWLAILLAAVLVFSMTACGEEEKTTLSGLVVSVEGTVISLVEMDPSAMGNRENAQGERPEGGGGFGKFNPEEFDGTLPDGETFPRWERGERPEMPEGMTLPEGMEFPEGMEPPEGTGPANGERPDFGNGEGGRRPGFGNFSEDTETKKVDIGNAHISIQNNDIKETGSLEDIQPGAFVTLTLNSKGEVTNVLVSSRGGFRGNKGGNN